MFETSGCGAPHRKTSPLLALSLRAPFEFLGVRREAIQGSIFFLSRPPVPFVRKYDWYYVEISRILVYIVKIIHRLPLFVPPPPPPLFLDKHCRFTVFSDVWKWARWGVGGCVVFLRFVFALFLRFTFSPGFLATPVRFSGAVAPPPLWIVGSRFLAPMPPAWG